MTSTSYFVRGLTCEVCVGRLMDEVRSVPGVTSVAVHLVRPGISRIRVSPAGAEVTAGTGTAIRRSGFRAATDDASPNMVGRRRGPHTLDSA